MTTDSTDIQRRSLLQVTAAQVTAGLAAAAPAALSLAQPASSPTPAATGKPGDFDFLSGHWRIENRRLKDGQWDVFDGEATVHGLLGGVVSVEELRIPARNFSGMGLRLLDPERKLWADHWVNAKSSVLTPPPTWGSFVDGVGIWDAEDKDGDTPVIYRGVWDQISAKGCRWYQASSRDGGRSWQQSWIMKWTRA